MKIVKAEMQELDTVMEIYGEAREYMRENGNLEQWSGGYPQRELVERDVISGDLFLCKNNGETVGVFFYKFGEDPTYKTIYGGEWLNEDKYGVIHRIAVRSHRKGVASQCFEWALKQCGNVKIDTHKDNIPMQRSLLKNGFSYCGIIHLENGDERLAYQIVK